MANAFHWLSNTGPLTGTVTVVILLAGWYARATMRRRRAESSAIDAAIALAPRLYEFAQRLNVISLRLCDASSDHERGSLDDEAREFLRLGHLPLTPSTLESIRMLPKPCISALERANVIFENARQKINDDVAHYGSIEATLSGDRAIRWSEWIDQPIHPLRHAADLCHYVASHPAYIRLAEDTQQPIAAAHPSGRSRSAP